MYANVMHVATELHTWQQQLVTGVHQGAKVGPHFARLQHNHPLQAAALTSSCRSPTSSGTRSTASPYCRANWLRSACSRSRLQTVERGGDVSGAAHDEGATAAAEVRLTGRELDRAIGDTDATCCSAPAARQRPFHAGLVVAGKVLRHQRPREPRGACIALGGPQQRAERPPWSFGCCTAGRAAPPAVGAAAGSSPLPRFCSKRRQTLAVPPGPVSPHTTTSNRRAGAIAGGARARGADWPLSPARLTSCCSLAATG